jgi:hypothetical protein
MAGAQDDGAARASGALRWLHRQVRIVRSSWQPPRLALGCAEGDAAAAQAAFAAWCAQHAGARIDLGLGAALVQVCVAPAALAQAELRDYAGRQLAHYFDGAAGAAAGAPDSGWTVAASSQPEVPLACAAPRALVAALQAAARAHGVRLRSLGPWWAQPAQAWLQGVADDGATRIWLAREPGWVTVLQASGRRLQRAWSEPEDGEWRIRLPRELSASDIAQCELAVPAAAGGAWTTELPQPR